MRSITQENMRVAQSDGMIATIQESATSIQTTPFCEDTMGVTIWQKGQLIMFADATSYGEGYKKLTARITAYDG
jgi:hypothetical protein